jgi:hypothetical protein
MAAQHFSGGPVKATGDPGGGDVVTVGPIVTGQHDRLTGAVFSDKAGTLLIEQSGDQQHWDIQTSYPITANDGTGFSEEVVLAFARVSFINTANTDTTEFRLFVRTTAAGSR